MTSQYDAYPYPPRDPKDEAKRLVTGAPSTPAEIDHFIYGGTRDWSQPFKALVAGGGTGDALVQLAQLLTDARTPYEITYLDLSTSAREIAEARIAARKLEGVTFHTASLLDAAQYGPFDYIDCCGVLHHLEDPVAGLKALEAALVPGGGLGFMVYATYGRSGVYPLQEAFAALAPDADPETRLKLAKAVLPKVPEGHPFRRNSNLGDLRLGNAGLYDLLLHQQDRAFGVRDWLEALEEAGLSLSGWIAPALYDLSLVTEVPEGMDPVTQAEIAEKLRGTITKHVGYAQRRGEVTLAINTPTMGLVPRLDLNRSEMVKGIAAGKAMTITVQGVRLQVKLPEAAAALLRRADGKLSLADMAVRSKIDAVRFLALWTQVHDALSKTGLLRYSTIGRRLRG